LEALLDLSTAGARKLFLPSLALALAALAPLAGCSTDDGDVTCGPGTVQVGSQCLVAGQVADGGALDATADGSTPPDGAVAADATGDGDASTGDDAAHGDEGDTAGDDTADGDARDTGASPDSAPDANPVAVCSDGGAPAGDPCPAAGAIDCSSSCAGGAACSLVPNGCAWGDDAGTALQLDVMALTTVRTPAGQLDTAACSMSCGEGGAAQASYSFAITTAGQWAKFTVPAPWRVAVPDGDLCHPVDTHCLLSKTGAVIVATDACMPARNITVEPISTGATCP
jgi:hypothetical protein